MNASAEPSLSEFAAYVKRTMTADELYSLIEVNDADLIPADVVLAEVEQIMAEGEKEYQATLVR